MSRLILCQGTYAEEPYLLKSIQLPIYCIEELCFYLYENVHMLDVDILDLELCTWIENKLQLKELGRKLFDAVRHNISLQGFVSMILEETGYVSEEELSILEKMLRKGKDNSPGARRKYKADYLQKSGRLAEAIREYGDILSETDMAETKLFGGLLHNMATAYAKLFLFERAASLYEKAYEITGDEDSYCQFIAAKRMYLTQEQFRQFLIQQKQTASMPIEAFAEKIEGTITESVAKNGDSDYDKEVSRLTGLLAQGVLGNFYQRTEQLLSDWKAEYRRMLTGSIT